MTSLNINIYMRMRFLISSITLIFFGVNVYSYNKLDTISPTKLGIRGPFSKVTVFNYSATLSSGLLLKGKLSDKSFAYEEKSDVNCGYFFAKGRQIKFCKYYAPNMIENEYIYHYNQSGKIISINDNSYYSDVTYRFVSKVEYNSFDSISAITRYKDNLLFDKKRFVYNESNKIVEYMEIDASGNIENKETFKYEPHSNLVIRNEEMSSSIGKNIFEFEYDSIGRVIKEYVNFDSQFIRNVFYDYDDKSRLLKTTDYDTEGKRVCSTVYLYFSNGELASEMTFFQNGSKYGYKKDSIGNSQITTKYTREGIVTITTKDNLVQECKIGNDTYTYKYTFDKYHNWIKIIEYKNTIPILIRERKIEI